MAINLLIDTNILRRLASTTEFSTYLQELEFYVKEKYVVLLAPDVLKTEWIKHSEIKKKIIETTLNDLKDEVRAKKLLQDDSAEVLQERIDAARRKLYSQFDLIDDLIFNLSTPVSTTRELIVFLHKQKKENKRPFPKANEKKKDNYNDAEMIFSALFFLRSQKENDLNFVSDNPSDFAQGDKPNYILHADIAETFPDILTSYFTDLKETYQSFDYLNIPRFKEETGSKFGKIQNDIAIDKSKPVLDQVYFYLEKRFKGVIVIPKKLFAEHYPFIIGDTFQYQHKPFTLITDNKDVFRLLTEVKINDGVVTCDSPDIIKSEEDEKKIIEIFKYMYTNFIHNVAFKNDDEQTITFSDGGAICDCYLCSYKRLNFATIIESATAVEEDNPESRILMKLRTAYGQYKIGNFIEAATLLQALYEERKGQKDIILYIICFNLSHIAPLLRHYYWENKSIQLLGDELLRFDLESVYNECKNYPNKASWNLIDWIHNKEFIKETFSGLHEKVNAITDHFYGQNTGFNNNTRRLMEYYLTVDAFLNQNSIIYDASSEFDSLTSLYTHGLFASYGCSPYLSGRLNYFSDLLLEKLMLSGKAEVIQKFLNRYKLANIEYTPNAKPGLTFVDVFENLLENYTVTSGSYNQTITHKHHYFWDNYSKIVYNALSLLAMIKLDSLIVNKIAEKFLTFLNGQQHIHYSQLLKHLRFFIYRKQKNLSDDVLKKYFVAALKNKEFYTDNYFESLVNILNERQIKVSVPDVDFLKVKKSLLDTTEKDSTVESWFSIGNIYSVITSEEQKETIRTYVAKSLKIKFENGKYYLATMFDMMPLYNTYIDQYTIEVEKVIKNGPQKRMFERKEYYTDSRIDNYLNFCLKYNLAIPVSISDLLPNMGKYYEWLSDMDNFDYSNFDTDWLYTHFTIYFKRKFRQCEPLKQHLLNLTKVNPHTEIERIFIVIYSFDD
jgi:PIN domain